MRMIMIVVLLAAACGGKKDEGKQAPKSTESKEELGPVKKVTEAQLQLNALGKKAKIYFTENAKFPVGKSATLPEAPCCSHEGDYKCPVTDAWTKDPVWSALGFQIDAPGLYQYTYEAKDDQNAVVTAVGDLDCDGKTATYTLTLGVANNAATMTITDPPAGAL